MGKSHNKLIKAGNFWIKAIFFLFVIEYFVNFFISDAPFVNKFLRVINITYIFQFFILILPGIILSGIGDKLEKNKKLDENT